MAKRKAIKRTHPVRVIMDAENDAHEISLDENMTREAMHPADQFEAFQRLAVEKGYGPEEIGARFGVSAHVVRQRLRLGSAAPELMAAYRAGTLALDQLTAFCVSEDQDRQRQVLEQVGPQTPAYAIRRAMTDAKVSVGDRRVRFVGVEAYAEAGGGVLRDLEKACSKLRVRTRIEAVAVAVRVSVIEPDYLGVTRRARSLIKNRIMIAHLNCDHSVDARICCPSFRQGDRISRRTKA